jgi:hypothetical protein
MSLLGGLIPGVVEILMKKHARIRYIAESNTYSGVSSRSFGVCSSSHAMMELRFEDHRNFNCVKIVRKADKIPGRIDFISICKDKY